MLFIIQGAALVEDLMSGSMASYTISPSKKHESSPRNSFTSRTKTIVKLMVMLPWKGESFLGSHTYTKNKNCIQLLFLPRSIFSLYVRNCPLQKRCSLTRVHCNTDYISWYFSIKTLYLWKSTYVVNYFNMSVGL